MRVNRGEVEVLLSSLSQLTGKVPTDSEGNLDRAEFNKLPEVAEAIATLKELGVRDRKHLGNLGFMVASMLLDF